MTPSAIKAWIRRLRALIAILFARVNGIVITLLGLQYVFVVDPLAVVSPAAPNVYNTLGQASAAAALVNGPKLIDFRGNQTVGAGTYDFRGPSGKDQNTRFTASSGLATVTFAAGATVLGVNECENISPVYQGAAVLFQLPLGVQLFLFTNGIGACTGGGLLVGAGAGQTIVVDSFGGFITSGGAPCFGTTAAGAFMAYQVFGGGGLAATTLSQVVGSTFIVFVSNSAALISTSQPGLVAGGLVVGTNYTISPTATNTTAADGAPVYGLVNVQGQLDEAKRCLASFSADSGVIASIAAPTTLATLPAIDLLANESLVITASAVFNKDVTPGACELIIEVDGVSVGNKGTSSDDIITNGTATASRTVQVKPAAGSRVVSIVGVAIGGDASLLAGGASVVARRVLA